MKSRWEKVGYDLPLNNGTGILSESTVNCNQFTYLVGLRISYLIFARLKELR